MKQTTHRDDLPISLAVNLTYYLVVLIAGVTGWSAYQSGASLEGALVRVLVALIAGTALGYAINFAMWLWLPVKAHEIPESHTADPSIGKRLDMVTGDDEDHPSAQPRSLRSTGRSG